jgi:hypothetical protein
MFHLDKIDPIKIDHEKSAHEEDTRVDRHRSAGCQRDAARPDN